MTGLTIDDFERLPDDLAHNHELVDGELIDVSGNTLGHNRLRDLLVQRLGAHLESHRSGEIISEQEFDFAGNAHGPDVSFVSAAKRSLFDGKLRVQRFVPDLAIEIVSQDDRFEALMKRLAVTASAAPAKCGSSSSICGKPTSSPKNRTRSWIENQQFRSDLIPGFSIRIGDLFDRI